MDRLKHYPIPGLFGQMKNTRFRGEVIRLLVTFAVPVATKITGF
jgi:hypothetical protein